MCVNMTCRRVDHSSGSLIVEIVPFFIRRGLILIATAWRNGILAQHWYSCSPRFLKYAVDAIFIIVIGGSLNQGSWPINNTGH